MRDRPEYIPVDCGICDKTIGYCLKSVHYPILCYDCLDQLSDEKEWEHPDD